MPLAHNLKKVSKSVGGSRGSVHIKGRNFKKLNRASLRHNKLINKKASHLDKKQNELSIVKYIQEEINQVDKEIFGLDDMKAFLENFITRYDEDLEIFRQERRPGRPPSAKHKILEEAAKDERDKYKTGIKIPDISDKTTVDRLRNWNGTIGGVTAFKYVTVFRDMQQLPVKEASMD